MCDAAGKRARDKKRKRTVQRVDIGEREERKRQRERLMCRGDDDDQPPLILFSSCCVTGFIGDEGKQ